MSHDNSQLQSSPPPKVTPAQIHQAARFVERTARNDDDCRELLDALGLAPTTKPLEGRPMTDYRTQAEKDAATRFKRDAARHAMTVLHQDGLYRHFRFTNNPRGYGEYWFDVITVPHALIFRGDGESYVFSVHPTVDLFDLFRRTAAPSGINPGYWSEKLTSERDAAVDYSLAVFERQVAEDLKDAEGSWPGVTKAWSEHVESEYYTDVESEARRALDDFEFGKTHTAKCSCGDQSDAVEDFLKAMDWEKQHKDASGDGHKTTIERQSFHFSDTWEWNLRDYDWWFLHACHGIRWGIARYDRLASYGLLNLAATGPVTQVARLTAERDAAVEARDTLAADLAGLNGEPVIA